MLSNKINIHLMANFAEKYCNIVDSMLILIKYAIKRHAC